MAIKIEKLAEDRYRYIYDDITLLGGGLTVDICKCSGEGKRSLPYLWHKEGFIDRILENYWSVDTYANDDSGNCYNKFNPQIKSNGRLDFDWMFEATEENKDKLFREIERRAYTFVKIGSYVPETDEEEEIIIRGATEQGEVYWNEEAFIKKLDEVCYIPELSDSTYNYESFLTIAGGNKNLAKELFYTVAWQMPETLLEEWIQGNYYTFCYSCGYIYEMKGDIKYVFCPICKESAIPFEKKGTCLDKMNDLFEHEERCDGCPLKKVEKK